MDFLQSVFGFVVAIGVLVTFHEFGHYWVAKRMGVQVLRFSVGFGRPLWQRQGRDGTVWQLAAIPLGGYVKMLDEREAEVPAELQHRAFNRQSVWARIAIVAAGPLANFLLALVFYALVYMLGQPALKPILGEVMAQTPAAEAGLRAGLEVRSVDGVPVRSWDELRAQLLESALGAGEIQLEAARGTDVAQSYRLGISTLSREPQQFFDGIGLQPPRVALQPLLGEVIAQGPAASAGLRSGDRILSLDGQPVRQWRELVELVRARPGAQVEVLYSREGLEARTRVQLQSFSEAGQSYGRLGAAVAAQPELWQDFVFEYRLGPLQSLLAGARQTLQMSVLTLKMLGRMVLGEVSVRNLSGPLSIAEFAGVSAAAGLVTFLGFMALVSVSLGVLNLLPVPVLDGGHLLYYVIEALTGAPLPERVQQMGQSIGIALLLALMSVALFNDVNRLLS
ncbi:MAG: RIP metalloprotease RseP [Oceanococcaceae bacterium]